MDEKINGYPVKMVKWHGQGQGENRCRSNYSSDAPQGRDAFAVYNLIFVCYKKLSTAAALPPRVLRRACKIFYGIQKITTPFGVVIFGERPVKIDISKFQNSMCTVVPLNLPSGRRRFCGVQVFSPKAKTLAEAEFISAEHSNHRRVERANGLLNPKRKT